MNRLFFKNFTCLHGCRIHENETWHNYAYACIIYVRMDGWMEVSKTAYDILSTNLYVIYTVCSQRLY